MKREHPSWGARKIRERLSRRFSDLTIPGKSTNPDVVLLDVAMPNLNGFEAAEIIKKYLPSATIFFVTQYDSLEMARATAEAGARGYIAKVYIPTDLVPAIEAAIDFPPIESPAL